MSIKLSHIAIAAPRLQAVLEKLKVLSLEVAELEEVPTEKVKVGMVPVQVSKDFRIELLEPMSEDSPVGKFLQKRSQGGLHHLCFEVSHLERWQELLENKGVAVLAPGIRPSARGRALFVHPSSMGGVLVELEEIA